MGFPVLRFFFMIDILLGKGPILYMAYYVLFLICLFLILILFTSSYGLLCSLHFILILFILQMFFKYWGNLIVLKE